MNQKSSNYRLFFIYILITISTGFLYSQPDIAIGTWRTHTSYKNLDNLIIVNNKVYASGNYGFMYFDREDNSANTLSKITGFADVEVTAMAFDEQREIMIIGYAGGSIDLIKNDVIVNNHEIRNAPIQGSKKINHITIIGPTAFLSTDFGIVVFDLQALAIKEIYENLGPGGSSLEIYSSIIYSDSIFLATSSGIMAGSMSENVNLMDHLNWRRYSHADGLAEGTIKHLVVFNNELFAGIDLQGLFVYSQNSWTPTSFLTTSTFKAINNSYNQLIISLDNALYAAEDKNQFNHIDDNLIMNPGNASYDKDGNLWIADGFNGLVSNLEGSFRSFSPGGPLRNDVVKLYHFNNKVIGLAGGNSSLFEPLNKEGSFYIFDQGKWTNFATSLQNVPQVRDIMDASYHAQSNKLYFTSFGDGILEWDQHDNFQIFNADSGDNSLQSTGDPSSTYVTGIATDNENKLWATNYGVPSSVHSLDPAGLWESFSFGNNTTRFPLGITFSNNGDKWINLKTERGAEILVFNGSLNAHRILTTKSNDGLIPGDQVNDIIQDNEGLMWIGTDKGVCYIMNPFSVLNNEPINAVVPRFEDGFLLRGENVTCIKVDGGNRKWIGTTRGLWLFDGLGETLIQNFTINNSPLPSNNIYDIEIDERTGEVFIATSKGLISYRGTATKATKEHRNVKIFPNPVRGNFIGQLGISGLSENAIVKITDIGGRLVRQLYAEGGTAVWDVNDNRGSRVRSGIYLVLSASVDGEETFIGKIAVIE